MDDRPCSTAICNPDGTWDGSRCWFCDWCPGFAPNCDGVWCDLDRCEWNCDSGVPTPILIDVGGDGFELTDARHGVGFDFYGNGRRMGLAWTASGAHNAWLVLDRNGNGKIDSAKEMFGGITEQPPSKDPNGFAALAVFDANHDGVIDINDRIFLELRLWVDHNHNGISEQGELYTLPSLGVNSISLKYTRTEKTDRYGNKFRYRAEVNGGDGVNGGKESHVGRFAYDVILVTAK
jgi:hypothetical protein